MEIIEASLGIVYIAAVAQGIQGAEGGGHGAGGAERIAPGVVGISHHTGAGTVDDADHIPLQVGHIVILGAIIGDRLGTAGCVISKAQDITVGIQMHKTAAAVGVAVVLPRPGSPGAHTVSIISEVPCSTVASHGRKLPSVLPAIAPCAIVQGISYGVVGDALTVVGSQRRIVAPLFRLCVSKTQKLIFLQFSQFSRWSVGTV